jgi:hypothetical protein
MTGDVGEQTGQVCCRQAGELWATDQIMLAAKLGWPIPPDVVDQLPPWRAELYVSAALAAGARLSHGTLEDLQAAVVRLPGAVRPPAGWWTLYLAQQPGGARPAPIQLRDQLPVRLREAMPVRTRNESPSGRQPGRQA